MRALWLDQAKRAPLLQVAGELGLEQARGRALTPCPACGAEIRGSSDRRGPVGVAASGRWSCYRCRARGDALDLVALALTGQRLDSLAVDQVRGWYAARGWCDPAQDAPPVRPVVPRPAPPPEPPPLERPPASEVLALWGATLPVSDVPEVASYLRRRGYEPAAVDRTRVARALPLAYPWPGWWPAAWARTWRLVTRAWEPDGRLASLHARAIVPTDWGKTRWPAGCLASGLLMVNARGLDLLRGYAQPGARVVVLEGLTGLVNLASLYERDDLALLAATSGGFRALQDVPWPQGAQVYIATDEDPAGDRYAQEILEAIPNTVTPRRVRFA